MTTTIETPPGASPRQRDHVERSRRLIVTLAEHEVLNGATLETIIDGKRFEVAVALDHAGALSFGESTEVELGEDVSYSSRLEVVLQPPFSTGILFLMTIDFTEGAMFLPEMLVQSGFCHAVSRAGQLDFVVTFEVE